MAQAQANEVLRAEMNPNRTERTIENENENREESSCASHPATRRGAVTRSHLISHDTCHLRIHSVLLYGYTRANTLLYSYSYTSIRILVWTNTSIVAFGEADKISQTLSSVPVPVRQCWSAEPKRPDRSQCSSICQSTRKNSASEACKRTRIYS